jgi:uncharacterized protein DUF6069
MRCQGLGHRGEGHLGLLGALAAACRRWAPHPRTWFIALAAIGTIASFVQPIVSDGTTATIVVLCITHVVAALIIVPPLAQTLRPR